MNSLRLSLWLIFMIYTFDFSHGLRELKPVKSFDYDTVEKPGMIKDVFRREAAYFTYIPGYSISNEELLLGARDRLFSMSVPDISRTREVIRWKAERCKNAHGYTCRLNNLQVHNGYACGNHIRFVLRNKRIRGRMGQLVTVCGSNGGYPKCQVYHPDKPMWKVISNRAGPNIVNEKVCPGEKNPFYYDEASQDLFGWKFIRGKPSLASFSFSDPHLIRAKRIMSESRSIYGRYDSIRFHAFFRYKDKIYIIFNEDAREAGINDVSFLKKTLGSDGRARKKRKKRFARVARVCAQDDGYEERAGKPDNWFSSFFKTRLLCSSPDGFTFDYLVAVDEVDSSEADPVIRGVFAADDSLTHAHGICAFRASEIERDIARGDFVTFERKETADSVVQYISKTQYPPALDKGDLMGCPKGKKPVGVAGFSHKYPLLTDPVMNNETYPWLAFTAPDYNITAMASERSTGHEVVFLATDNGKLLKLSSLPAKLSSTKTRPGFHVVESLQLFPVGVTINSLILRQNHVVAVSNHEVRTVPVHRCRFRRSCHECMILGDPHCSWDGVTSLCSSTAKRFPSIETGLEYCKNINPDDKLSLPPVSSHFKKVSTSDNVSVTTASVVGTCCALVGFLLGAAVGWLAVKHFLRPSHLLHEINRRYNRRFGRDKQSPLPVGLSNAKQESIARSKASISNANDYDDFLDHCPPSSVPLNKKTNIDLIKNNLRASINESRSIDNFL